MLFVAWFDFGSDLGLGQGLDVLEFFAGCARIARIAHRRGLKSRAHEILFDKSRKGYKKDWTRKRSSFDINGEAGFAKLS